MSVRALSLELGGPKVANSGAARVTGGLAPSFFVNMSVNVSQIHIAVYFMFR
jgi:hypothetical protein